MSLPPPPPPPPPPAPTPLTVNRLAEAADSELEELRVGFA